MLSYEHGSEALGTEDLTAGHQVSARLTEAFLEHGLGTLDEHHDVPTS